MGIIKDKITQLEVYFYTNFNSKTEILLHLSSLRANSRIMMTFISLQKANEY